MEILSLDAIYSKIQQETSRFDRVEQSCAQSKCGSFIFYRMDFLSVTSAANKVSADCRSDSLGLT
jgi:hypothetical protein